MTAATHIHWGALALGAALAAFTVTGWRVEGGVQAPAARVALVTSSSSAVGVTPGGRKTERKALRPSELQSGLTRRLAVRNATAAPIDVRVQAQATSVELNELLSLRVTAGGKQVFDGKLGELEGGSAPFTLASHEATDLTVVAWIPQDTPKGWEARVVTVELELVTGASA